jgi:hypothetical protein
VPPHAAAAGCCGAPDQHSMAMAPHAVGGGAAGVSSAEALGIKAALAAALASGGAQPGGRTWPGATGAVFSPTPAGQH